MFSCSMEPEKITVAKKKKEVITERLYSKFVNDSFVISVSIPDGYNESQNKKYPVVYLLDGSLYFDVLATVIRKYSEVGLASDVILIGIGYKDFPTMDSLRTRDDIYPLAIAEYEMSTSGGAPKFLSFISKELIPYIDQKYPADSSRRILMGHSFGGYFTAFALLRTLEGENTGIHGFIAASPSFHYNKYYLLEKLKNLSPSVSPVIGVKTYITFGGLEEEPSSMSLKNLDSSLSEVLEKKVPISAFKFDLFSNLEHMDTQLPTFLKGLQWMLTDAKEKK